jgi:hypothetical protein
MYGLQIIPGTEKAGHVLLQGMVMQSFLLNDLNGLEFKMKIRTGYIIIISYLFQGLTIAGGLDYNTTYGTRTFTLNGLYFAGSPGISSISSNPAGLTALRGRAFEISVMNRIEQNEFENPDRGLHKSFRNDKYTFGGGIYWQFSENLGAGLSYHPVIDYKADWPFAVLRATDTASSVLSFSMMNRLEIMSISPALAFRIGPLNIGIAGNIYRVVSQINFPRNNEGWGQNEGLAAYQFSYDLDSWAYGGTIGLLYDINEVLKIGVNAKSGFKADLKGRAESRMFSDLEGAPSRVDASSEFEIPWKFGLGFLYSINNSTFLNVDGGYSLWGNTGTNMAFAFEDPVWQNRTSEMDSLPGFSANTIPLAFNNSLDIGVGIEHFTTGGIIYRGSYRFSQSINSGPTYSFLFPLVDQHIIALGIGYRDANLTLDAGIAYTFGTATEVLPTENRFLYGEYFTDSYIPSVTLRYEF